MEVMVDDDDGAGGVELDAGEDDGDSEDCAVDGMSRLRLPLDADVNVAVGSRWAIAMEVGKALN